MNILKVTLDDWKKVKKLLVSSCRESPDAFSASVDERSSDSSFIGFVKKWSGGKNEIAFILSNREGEWGFILGGIHNIGHFWVDPKYRDKKLGKKLFYTYLEWAQSKGSNQIYLYVTEGTSAVQFYKSLGFFETDEKEILRPGSEKWMIKMNLMLQNKKSV